MVVIVNVNIFPSKVVLEYQSTTTYHAHTSVFGKSDFSFSRKWSQQMSWIFNSRPGFFSSGVIFFWKSSQMLQKNCARFYFLRSPPKIGKIFWRFAPKHNDFALIYDPKCSKFSGASRRIFFHCEVIFFANCLEFDPPMLFFLKSSPNVDASLL